jgi:hypothetical protein
LSGREGFRFLSPSCLASSAGFDTFVEVKRLFSTALKAKKQRRTEVSRLTGRWTEYSLSMTRRVWSVAADVRGVGR